jgi:hypothetical protein
MTETTDFTRFSVDNFDRSEIAQIQRETGLDFQHAQLIYEYRWKAARNLYENERTLCKELERQLARKKAEAAIPLRTHSNNDGYHAPPQASSARAQASSHDGKTEALPEQDKPAIAATPFRWRDPDKIPARKWLYGRHYARQFLTCTIASSGMGKTSLAIGEALSMAKADSDHIEA